MVENFNLDKKKYKKDEVENLISTTRSEMQLVIDEQKEKIDNLISDVKRLEIEKEALISQNDEILSTIKDAEAFASSLKRDAKQKYLAEMQSLSSFALRWRAYFDALIEKYPLYGKVVDSKKVYDTVKSILKEYPSDKVIDNVGVTLDDNNCPAEPVFDPKSKIDDYMLATSDNGFDMNEVLNAGELKLEDLCRELGLLDEDI